MIVGSVTFFLDGALEPSGECDEWRTGVQCRAEALVWVSGRKTSGWQRPRRGGVIVVELVKARDSMFRVAIVFSTSVGMGEWTVVMSEKRRRASFRSHPFSGFLSFAIVLGQRVEILYDGIFMRGRENNDFPHFPDERLKNIILCAVQDSSQSLQTSIHTARSIARYVGWQGRPCFPPLGKLREAEAFVLARRQPSKKDHLKLPEGHKYR